MKNENRKLQVGEACSPNVGPHKGVKGVCVQVIDEADMVDLKLENGTLLGIGTKHVVVLLGDLSNLPVSVAEEMTGWLRKNKDVLSVSGLEKKLKCRSVFQKAIDGSQALSYGRAADLRILIQQMTLLS